MKKITFTIPAEKVFWVTYHGAFLSSWSQHFVGMCESLEADCCSEWIRGRMLIKVTAICGPVIIQTRGEQSKPSPLRSLK